MGAAMRATLEAERAAASAAMLAAKEEERRRSAAHQLFLEFMSLRGAPARLCRGVDRLVRPSVRIHLVRLRLGRGGRIRRGVLWLDL